MTADQKRAISFWRESAESDIATARDLVKLKRYHWALFLYHLAIEKLLKALVINAGITPPYTHDLKRLVTISKIKTDNDFNAWLKEISTYNLEARYPAEKLTLYKKASLVYTKLWSKRCEEIYQWLQKQIN